MRCALIAVALCLGSASGTRAQECSVDAYLAELVPQVDRAEALLEEDRAAAAKPILEAVFAQEVAADSGSVPARCSGRLVFALARTYFALGQRQRAAQMLARLAALPTRPRLLERGRALQARLDAQVQVTFVLPAWAAGRGTLSLTAAGRSVSLVAGKGRWVGHVDPDVPLELTHSGELFEPTTRTLAFPAPGPHEVRVDGLSPLLVPLPAASLPGEARRAAGQARAAALRADWGAAARSFAEAREGAPDPRLDYNLAFAQLRAGRPALARHGFAVVEGAQAPPWLKTLAKRARERLDASLVRVSLRLSSDVMIWVNRRALERMDDGSWVPGASGVLQGPRPVGEVLLRVPLAARIDLQFDKPYPVAVDDGPMRVAGMVSLSPGPGSAVRVAVGVPTSAVAIDSQPSLLIPALLGAGGLAVGAVAFGFFRAAADQRDEVMGQGRCDSEYQCTPSGAADMADAQRWADYATVGTVAGSVLGAGAVLWFLLDDSDTPDGDGPKLGAAPGGVQLSLIF